MAATEAKRVKAYLFSLTHGEGGFCNMLTKYKSLTYIIAASDEEECRVYVQFGRPTNLPQKKLKDVQCLEVHEDNEENINWVKEVGTPWLEMTINKEAKQRVSNKEFLVLNVLDKLEFLHGNLRCLLDQVEGYIHDLEPKGPMEAIKE